MREITFAEAIAEATLMAMRIDPNVFVMGVGVDDSSGIFGTTKSAHDEFGDARVFDMPLAENALTGVAAGAAIMGSRPILVHARTDFLALTLDQIANHAAKWSYMSGGALKVPLVIRAIVGRGWGQGAQHSQSLQAMVAGFPGLHVVMPTTPADAKGLLLYALTGHTPTIFIEHRWLHKQIGEVPEEFYTVPVGKARVARVGSDITIVAASHMVVEAEVAAEQLLPFGIKVEILDLRSIRPWDVDAVCASVEKTQRLIIADTAWTAFGISAEIAAIVGERLFGQLLCPIKRVGLPASPTPCCPTLERIYYPDASTLCSMAQELVCGRAGSVKPQSNDSDIKPFVGHF